MRAARLEDVDPQTVELEPAPAEVERARLGKARDMLVEQLHQIGEARVARRQVVERGIGRVAAIAMRLRPGDARAIFPREVEAGLLQFRDQRGIAKLVIVEARREQRTDGHGFSLIATSFMNRTSSPSASHGASAPIAPSMSARSSSSALA